MGTDKQPQLTDVCHLCKKPFGMHSPIRQYCPRQEDPPFEEWKVFTFTPSPEPVAESEGEYTEADDPIQGGNYPFYVAKGQWIVAKCSSKKDRKMILDALSEVSRLTSENERLRDALKQAMPYARDQFCPIELQERVNALLSPKSDKP